ncbi:protease Do-like 9 [Cyclospora cayetanensis]|uniref:Protease Do-like 9 n=1 Tax=Cyclospora cayetanensis TaxID=88456 RepID=A0A6P6S0S2_9EIME|nr:protease Do-like 9 [Cyclospora cayetanensis]
MESVSECVDGGCNTEPAALPSAPESLSDLCGSVLKVYSDYTDPNYALPWQMQRQGSSTGSGFIVSPEAGLGGKHILTNAHCVAWHNRLHVRKHGSPVKFPARVLAVAHECDLALLTVDDDAFWTDTRGLQFGEVDAAINPGNSGGPALKGGRVVGVAFQGCEASAAQNVGYIVPWTVIRHFFEDLSRHRRYTGFPAAGVLFQQLENESMQQKLGVTQLKPEDLPTGLLRLPTARGRVRLQQPAGKRICDLVIPSRRCISLAVVAAAAAGVTASGILVTATDALRTRNFLDRAKAAVDEAISGAAASTAESGGLAGQVEHAEKGPIAAEAAADGNGKGEATVEDSTPLADPSEVVREAIAQVDTGIGDAEAAGNMPPSAAERKALIHEALDQRIGLRPEDVVLAIDGVDVAGDGTVHFRGMERVSVTNVISEKFLGETLSLTVLRNRKVQNVVVPLEAESCLIPKHQWGKKARYIIYGGLVFCPLTLEYLKDEFGPKFHERAPSTLLRPLSEVFATVEGEEPIVLTQILASDLTSGYSVRNCMLSSVDGVKVRNLRHLAQLLGIQAPQQQHTHQKYLHSQKQQHQEQQQQQSQFVTFVLEEKFQVVLNREKAEAMLADILQQHAIHKQTSDNL